MQQIVAEVLQSLYFAQNFFNKIYDITHTDFHSGSDKVFVANVSEISTFNENVLDSKWTSTSHTLRLVVARTTAIESVGHQKSWLSKLNAVDVFP